ncbi:MAG: type III-B CRISPR module-associated protein Cmr5 [Acidobacteriota bacterium]|uniref:CRISPR type III-B/RAMP module-associated protein Cmr5 n=2 Tax=Thermoanaerobaculum aquaticum TaxID=1312852 RepID=A0A7C2N8K0_9BACT|nr:hypothetical protein HRbin09_01574 [bacterium HR09]
MTQSLEQKRAAFAWKVVKGQSTDYVNLAKAAPALVMGNGLMQTLAFFKSKGEEGHHADLLQHVLAWLSARNLVTKNSFSEAMDELANMSSEQYLAATEEALAILKWIRQLAAAQAKDRSE